MENTQSNSSLAVFTPSADGFKFKDLKDFVKAKTGYTGKALRAAVQREVNRGQPVMDAMFARDRQDGCKVQARTIRKNGTIVYELQPADGEEVAVRKAERLEEENGSLQAQIDEMKRQMAELLAARQG